MIQRRMSGRLMRSVPLINSGDGLNAYIQKNLGYSPIAYWPLLESSGTIAECLVNPAQNGTYERDVAIMGTGAGIGDGGTAPIFNGINGVGGDAINVHSAALNAALNGALITLVGWGIVKDIGSWTGVFRRIIELAVDGNNKTFLMMWSGTGDMLLGRNGGGILDQAVGQTNYMLNWFCAAVTVSEAADEVKGYLDGVQQGGIETGLGAYVGNLSATNTNISSDDITGPFSTWEGRLAHIMAFDKVLTQPQLADIATV